MQEFGAKLWAQWKSNAAVLVGLYAPMLVVVAVSVAIGLYLRVPVGVLTRDPSATTGSGPFVGMLSNVGVLFWCGSTVICFFSYAVLRLARRAPGFPKFFLVGGTIGGILLLDDLFLLHESVYPDYLGIPENLIYFTYGVLLLGFIVRFRKLILQTDFIFLFLAYGLFGVSIVFDLLDLRISMLYEDVAKLFGIVSWFGYFARTGFQQARTIDGLTFRLPKPRRGKRGRTRRQQRV